MYLFTAEFAENAENLEIQSFFFCHLSALRVLCGKKIQRNDSTCVRVVQEEDDYYIRTNLKKRIGHQN
jgi:hypothetical protein